MKRNFLFAVLLFYSCSHNEDRKNSGTLVLRGNLTLPVSERTIVQTDAMFPFLHHDNLYLGFLNNGANEILIYDIDSANLDRRISLPTDGDLGVGTIKGFMIFQPDTIYITSRSRKHIYITDGAGRIIDKIFYANTIDGQPVEMAYYSRSDINTPLIRNNKKLYLTNYLFGNYNAINAEILNEHPVCVEVDEVTRNVRFMPMKFISDYWDKESHYEPSYIRIFNDKSFVYMWRYSDRILVTEDHVKIKEYKIRSQYFSDFGKIPPPDNIEANLRDLLASPCFFNITWDQYRSCYYVFAYPGQEVTNGMDLMNAWRYLNRFSVIVLNEDFNILSETMMPENTYYIQNYFVGKEGLYISKNNPNNPEYSDDELVFDIFLAEDLRK